MIFVFFGYDISISLKLRIFLTGKWPCNLYYKRVDPYICSAKAPVLEGSGSRRLYSLKGTIVDRVSVEFVARADRRIFLQFVKNGFFGAFAEGNSAPLKLSRLLP